MKAKPPCPRCLAEAGNPDGDLLSAHTASARCRVGPRPLCGPPEAAQRGCRSKGIPRDQICALLTACGGAPRGRLATTPPRKPLRALGRRCAPYCRAVGRRTTCARSLRSTRSSRWLRSSRPLSEHLWAARFEGGLNAGIADVRGCLVRTLVCALLLSPNPRQISTTSKRSIWTPTITRRRSSLWRW